MLLEGVLVNLYLCPHHLNKVYNCVFPHINSISLNVISEQIYFSKTYSYY